ncbi:hypothetical protein HMPREF1862_00165 [Varibaculum cambriense]|uniref:Uncharacterized protein n=1 Tax=Varibaculum cambriense TaxID=184870 RepID=A0AB34X1V4_9ACTO|nr:hypothetical protein HMPREF1862_00165 [Varibaculum cambriense]
MPARVSWRSFCPLAEKFSLGIFRPLLAVFYFLLRRATQCFGAVN